MVRTSITTFKLLLLASWALTNAAHGDSADQDVAGSTSSGLGSSSMPDMSPKSGSYSTTSNPDAEYESPEGPGGSLGRIPEEITDEGVFGEGGASMPNPDDQSADNFGNDRMASDFAKSKSRGNPQGGNPSKNSGASVNGGSDAITDKQIIDELSSNSESESSNSFKDSYNDDYTHIDSESSSSGNGRNTGASNPRDNFQEPQGVSDRQPEIIDDSETSSSGGARQGDQSNRLEGKEMYDETKEEYDENSSDDYTESNSSSSSSSSSDYSEEDEDSSSSGIFGSIGSKFDKKIASKVDLIKNLALPNIKVDSPYFNFELGKDESKKLKKGGEAYGDSGSSAGLKMNLPFLDFNLGA